MHYSTYPEMCERNNIPLVILCPEEDGGGSVQSDLSSFVVKTTWVAPWGREGLLLHICEWIVLDNQVRTSLYIMSYILIYIYSVILCCQEGKESFKALLNYQCQSSIPCDFPRRMMVTDEIDTKSVCVKGLLAEKFRAEGT